MIHAFLRTSEQGSWEPDGSVPSDAFVLHYRRGEPSPRPHGRLFHYFEGRWGEDYESSVIGSGWAKSVGSPLMQLKVVLRPSSDQVHITLENSLVDPHASLLLKAFGDRFQREFQAEVGALVTYLKELLQIPERPEISHD